jgi:hypothetical protein
MGEERINAIFDLFDFKQRHKITLDDLVRLFSQMYIYIFVYMHIFT